MSESSSATNITIGLWNANGLQKTTVADVLSHCQSFDILFVTESWILSPYTLPTAWTDFHTYGNPVTMITPTGKKVRGSNGIVALINPDCSVPINHLPSSNPYTLNLQFGQLRISCFYLPPSLSTSQAMAILDSVPLQEDTILCGDFNARLFHVTGDKISNAR